MPQSDERADGTSGEPRAELAVEPNAEPAGDAPGAVVETRVVSPKGARVTETVFVLSSRASRQLEIRGELPASRAAARWVAPRRAGS